MRGREYDELIDELIVALRERYGANFILHWEDFNVRNSFRLLDKYVAQVHCSSPYVLNMTLSCISILTAMHSIGMLLACRNRPAHE